MYMTHIKSYDHEHLFHTVVQSAFTRPSFLLGRRNTMVFLVKRIQMLNTRHHQTNLPAWK